MSSSSTAMLRRPPSPRLVRFPTVPTPAPYAADSDSFRLLAHVQRAEVVLDGLPRELDGLIRPLLERDPSSRPPPRDVLAAFEREPIGGGELLPARWASPIRLPLGSRDGAIWERLVGTG
ncbi:hypothetical protein ABZ318_03530 [Streptomyces sp. NPDC006197]|uniref:hypothetical protein n=1 Tax=Streptomyces sp. NPDC006197 TaxID=3156685 RepID=UPI0033AFACA6